MHQYLTAALLTLLLAITATPATAGQSFSSAGEAGQWIMGYYLDPQPERLDDALVILSESHGITDDGRKLIVSFVGAALAAAPKEQDAFFKAVEGNIAAQLYALPSFWFMNNEAGAALIKRAEKQWKGDGVGKLAAQLSQAPSPNLLEGKIKNPLQLDHLWSMFFATGKAEPVLKIISALSLINDPDINLHVIGQSALWSLQANGRVHPKVQEYVKGAMQGCKEPLCAHLAQILEQ